MNTDIKNKIESIKHFHFPEISSTNDLAKELIAENEIVIVTADYQTQGRGRNERIWVGNPGDNVYCSIGIKHSSKISFSKVMLFQVLGAMVAASTLRHISNDSIIFKLKYPNDVMALIQPDKFGKICGVLAEHSFQGEFCTDTIIGIGINVNQTEFTGVTHNEPTSLKLLGVNSNPKNVIKVLIDAFKDLYSLSLSTLFDLWKQELNFIGKPTTISNQNGEWLIKELMPDGRVKAQSIDNGEIIIIDNGDSIRYELS